MPDNTSSLGASRPLKIIYSGPGLSGRGTSLLQVLRAAGLNVERDELWQAREWRFGLTMRSASYEIEASVSRERGLKWYSDPRSPGLDAQVVKELDELPSADGFVFIVDSRSIRMEASVEAFEQLAIDLASRGGEIANIPIVFQANWRDAADVCTMDWVRETFRVPHCTHRESVAISGLGTTESIVALVELIVGCAPQRTRSP